MTGKKSRALPGSDDRRLLQNQCRNRSGQHANQRGAVDQLQTEARNHVTLFFVQAFDRPGDDADR